MMTTQLDSTGLGPSSTIPANPKFAGVHCDVCLMTVWLAS